MLLPLFVRSMTRKVFRLHAGRASSWARRLNKGRINGLVSLVVPLHFQTGRSESGTTVGPFETFPLTSSGAVWTVNRTHPTSSYPRNLITDGTTLLPITGHNSSRLVLDHVRARKSLLPAAVSNRDRLHLMAGRTIQGSIREFFQSSQHPDCAQRHDVPVTPHSRFYLMR